LPFLGRKRKLGVIHNKIGPIKCGKRKLKVQKVKAESSMLPNSLTEFFSQLFQAPLTSFLSQFLE
jgi:hypothetical protein